MHKGGKSKWAWQGHSHSNRLCCFFPEREALWWWGLSMQAQNDWETYYRHCQGSCFWGWILLMPLDASVKVRVCEELHAASASRMSLCWLVFRQASEAFSSSSRAMRLAVPLLEISNVLHTENQRCCIILPASMCLTSGLPWYIGLHRSYLACGVQRSVHAAQREKHYVLKVGHAVAQKITQIQSRTKWGLIFQSLLKSVCEQSHFRQVCVLMSWHSFNF